MPCAATEKTFAESFRESDTAPALHMSAAFADCNPTPTPFAQPAPGDCLTKCQTTVIRVFRQLGRLAVGAWVYSYPDSWE